MDKHLSDEQLVDFLVQGSEKAYEEIYNRYWYNLFAIAYHETGTKEEAEELVHDVFESLWNRRKEAVIRHLSSYLVVSIKHQITNYIKGCITQRKYQEYLIFMDLSKALEEVLKKLPERTCEVFRLSRFESQSTKDIASKLNITEKGVEYHITQSLKLMREHLKAYQQSDN
jgi:RNA polymerase sigma factor (sigma-70 family)